jgi:hypothetical protein
MLKGSMLPEMTPSASRVVLQLLSPVGPLAQLTEVFAPLTIALDVKRLPTAHVRGQS